MSQHHPAAAAAVGAEEIVASLGWGRGDQDLPMAQVPQRRCEERQRSNLQQRDHTYSISYVGHFEFVIEPLSDFFFNN